jgi:RimJ/RimL family protein N-acetyltransferase
MPPIDPDVLDLLVETSTRHFRRIDDDAAARPIKPDRDGEWSSKQLLGHLVDSALNNHARIIRAQIKEHLDADGVLRVPGYQQEAWVSAGGYSDQDWTKLIELWGAVNRQLVHTLRNFNPTAMDVPLSIDGSEPQPIGTALDYLDHLRMHLADFPSGEPPTVRPLPPELVADGLLLRIPTHADAPALITAVQDPEIPKWTTVPSPFGKTEADAWINRELRWHATADLRRNYLVFDGPTLVAMVGLVRVNEEDESGEVGYWCAKEARGKRVIRRALSALLREVLLAGYQRIAAEIIVGNEASERVLLGAGFRKEGRLYSVGSHGCGEDAARIDVESFCLLPGDPAAIDLLGGSSRRSLSAAVIERDQSA